MTPDPKTPDPKSVLQELTNAARPYGFRVVLEPQMLLPDLVFLRPGDGSEVARLRYFETEGCDPCLQTLGPDYVGQREQQEVEAHLAKHVAPVILRALTYSVWMRLAD